MSLVRFGLSVLVPRWMSVNRRIVWKCQCCDSVLCLVDCAETQLRQPSWRSMAIRKDKVSSCAVIMVQLILSCSCAHLIGWSYSIFPLFCKFVYSACLPVCRSLFILLSSPPLCQTVPSLCWAWCHEHWSCMQEVCTWNCATLSSQRLKLLLQNWMISIFTEWIYGVSCVQVLASPSRVLAQHCQWRRPANAVERSLHQVNLHLLEVTIYSGSVFCWVLCDWGVISPFAGITLERKVVETRDHRHSTHRL